MASKTLKGRFLFPCRKAVTWCDTGAPAKSGSGSTPTRVGALLLMDMTKWVGDSIQCPLLPPTPQGWLPSPELLEHPLSPDSGTPYVLAPGQVWISALWVSCPGLAQTMLGVSAGQQGGLAALALPFL